jgi:hypothetical protein
MNRELELTKAALDAAKIYIKELEERIGPVGYVGGCLPYHNAVHAANLANIDSFEASDQPETVAISRELVEEIIRVDDLNMEIEDAWQLIPSTYTQLKSALESK